MKVTYSILAAFILILASCHKGVTDRPHPQQPAPPPPAGTPAVLGLKDMNERNLPSPYYHFEYNDSGLISLASHTGGLAIYKVSYTGKDILAMQNRGGNRDVLHYEYANSNLTAVEITNSNGIVYRRIFFSYNTSNQLKNMQWEVLDGTGFSSERTILFTYYPDGNLKKLTEQHYAVGNQTESMVADTYENYDDKPNADGFSLLHPEQFMHLILLPNFKLQLNNPRRQIRTGDGLNFTIDYTYTYDAAGRPLVKDGDMLWTSGPEVGRHFQAQSTFSYY